MSPGAEGRPEGPGDCDSGGGWIVANLDVEQDLARSLPPPMRPRGGPTTLPLKVRRPLAAFATLMRACARPGDRLWLPEEVDPAVMVEHRHLPRPPLVFGPLPTNARSCVAWGDSRRVAALRRADDGTLSAAGDDADLPFHLLPWAVAGTRPEVVARVHHRAFAFALGHTLGYTLPGARWLSGLADLEAQLRRTPWDRASPWVVKAPLSAAGRDRVWGVGRSLDPPLRRSLDKLFARWPGALFEPWVERLDDFGACGVVDGEAVRTFGWHRQLLDSKGRFRGIELTRPRGGASIPNAESTLVAVGKALQADGYRGPFGIDGFSYRRTDGSTAWHTLGEINARWTFGWVARLLAHRLAPTLGAWHRLRLRLSTSGPAPTSMAGGGIVPLLRAAGDSLAGAWFEVFAD